MAQKTYIVEKILGQTCKSPLWQRGVSPENNILHAGKAQILGLKSSSSAQIHPLAARSVFLQLQSLWLQLFSGDQPRMLLALPIAVTLCLLTAQRPSGLF